MRKFRSQLLPRTMFIVSLMFTAPSFADKYYRWTGPDGVVHYGSRPPEGVEAELISTFGSAKPNNTTRNSSANEAQEERSYTEKQQAVLQERQAQCEQERSRLTSLKTTRSRIQMVEADGTKRYLSPDEVVQEIANSERFINEACNK